MEVTTDLQEDLLVKWFEYTGRALEVTNDSQYWHNDSASSLMIQMLW